MSSATAEEGVLLPHERRDALVERLRETLVHGDEAALRGVIEDAIEQEPWWVSDQRNLSHWLYSELRQHRGRKWRHSRADRTRMVRALYEVGLSHGQLASIFRIGKGTVNGIVTGLDFGKTVGFDGVERRRGMGSGGRPRRDLMGESFGYLTVIDEAEARQGRRYWLCECACGQQTVARQDNLTQGRTRSCGCRRGSVEC